MNEANIQTGSVMTALLSSSKLKENLTELHIIVRTTGFKVRVEVSSQSMGINFLVVQPNIRPPNDEDSL